jgi:hypothetical protein
VLNRRATESSRKAPSGHMKTRLQPSLPCRPRISRLRKESTGRVEKPSAGFQAFTTLTTPPLVRRNRPLRESEVPLRVQLRPQNFGAFGNQGGYRRTLPMPTCLCVAARRQVQSSQYPRTHSAQPTVQRRKVWRVLAQSRHGLPQRDRGVALTRVRAAGRLDHWPCVTLAWSDLHGQDPYSPIADRASAFRHRCRAMVNAVGRRPLRPTRHPPTGIDHSANGATRRACNLPAHRFAFHSGGFQSIIRDGDRNRDNTLSGSPRGTGA